MMNTQYPDEIYSKADDSIAISLRKTGSEQFTWTVANLNPERRATIVILPPTPFEDRMEVSLPPSGAREVVYDNVKPSYRWKIAKMVGSGGLSYEILCDIKMLDIEQGQRLSTVTGRIRTRTRPVVSDTQTTTILPKGPAQKPSEHKSPGQSEEFDSSELERVRRQLQLILENARHVQSELTTMSENAKQFYRELRTTVQNINALYERQEEVCEQTEQFHSDAQQAYNEIAQIRMELEDILAPLQKPALSDLTSSSKETETPPLQVRQHQAKSLEPSRRDDDNEELVGKLTEILETVDECKAELTGNQIVKSPEAWSIITNFERNVKSMLQDGESRGHPETLKLDLAYNLVDSVDVLEKNGGQSNKILEILKEYRRRILAQLYLEIIPIELDKTRVDARLHNIHSTVSGDSQEGVIVEVVQNGIRNATTQKTIRKAAVVRGDAG